MKSYQAKKRKRRLSSMILIVAVLSAVGAGLLFLVPWREEVAYVPTDIPTPTVTPVLTATTIQPTPTPYPPGDQWDLTVDSLSEWQMGIVLHDLQKFWAVYMAPEGLIDCGLALDLVAKSNPPSADGIIGECTTVQENGLFETSLPLSKLKVTEVQLVPDKGYVALQLDTTKEWPAQVRYLSDNGLKNVVTMSRAIYNVILIYEEGMWRLVGLQRFIEGEDF